MAATLQIYPFKKLSLFAGVEDEQLQRWLSQCEYKYFSKKAIVLQPNMCNEQMYVILQGEVTIHLNHASTPAIAEVGEGECVGEMSLFDSQNPSAYVLANTDLETLMINRELLLSMVDESHQFAKNLLYLLSSRLRSGNRVVNSSQRLQKEFEHHANVDALTGLYNRRWMDDFFKRLAASEALEKDYAGLSLMMVDVDHFKQFNDQYGHNAGDLALKCVAVALHLNIRSTDIAIRYGGEEFIILLPQTPLGEAQMIAERVRNGVASTLIRSQQQAYPAVTISIGLADWQANELQSDLVAAADEALYLAKTLGRNKVCLNDRQRIMPMHALV